MTENEKGTIAIYESQDGQIHLDVEMHDETVWLTQGQMSSLLGRSIPTISEHIKHVFEEGELEPESTIRKYRTVGVEGKRKVARELEYYNLDIIISVGYRVKSKRGTQFRIWATKLLKEYIKKGYVLRAESIEKRNVDVKGLIGVLENFASSTGSVSEEALGMLKILNRYASSFTLMNAYDMQILEEPRGQELRCQLTVEEVRYFVTSLKQKLLTGNEATDLFGRERDNILDSIIGNIHQTFNGEPLYRTVESRAAHLLYFMVKDHPFVDGNKRSAAFVFLNYLSDNNSLYKEGSAVINQSGLVALTLFIAESNPVQKNLMIRLIQNLIGGLG
jgi:prophage maintenance system killer protein